MKINIIGDIAGQYDKLIELINIMPKSDLIISVGDLVDRGPKSREVIGFFMSTPNAIALMGNHELMMVDAVKSGDYYLWFYNGGSFTVKSYGVPGQNLSDIEIPPDHIDWLSNLPLYYETDDLVISHAPLTSIKNLEHSKSTLKTFVWNRVEPTKPQKKFMIYGHNGKLHTNKWGDGSEVAMCIDDSHNGKLTGIHWPTKEIFQVNL